MGVLYLSIGSLRRRGCLYFSSLMSFHELNSLPFLATPRSVFLISSMPASI